MVKFLREIIPILDKRGIIMSKNLTIADSTVENRYGRCVDRRKYFKIFVYAPAWSVGRNEYQSKRVCVVFLGWMPMLTAVL